MVVYECFSCGKEIQGDLVKKRVRCPYCGARILIKVRNIVSKVKAV